MDFMNDHTRTSLEFEYIMNLINPCTPYGIQKKNGMTPFKPGQEDLLQNELDELEKLILKIGEYGREVREITFILHNMEEIRGSVKRACNELILDDVEFFQIKNFMLYVKDIYDIQNKITGLSDNLKLYRGIAIEKLLDPDDQKMRTFYIYDSYSEKLSDIRSKKRELKINYDSERKKITLEVERLLGIKLKLSGEINILKSDLDKLNKARECPYLTEGASTLLQTTFRLKNNEKLDEISKSLENFKLEEDCEEYGVRTYLSREIKNHADTIYDLTDRVGNLDLYIAKAEMALTIGGTKPSLHKTGEIYVKNGMHIRLSEMLRKKGMKFSPITLKASSGVTVITGANMGGKTVNLKVSGMLALMTHYGLFVPAEGFTTCLFDFIYFSIGDMQSIDTGLSTFGSEISSMIDILKHSAYRGLILIDELARGTNPEEGYAISRAIVKHLKTSNAITLFTTHFDGITEETGITHLQVRGLKNVDFSKLIDRAENRESGINLVLQHMDYSLEEVKGEYEVPRDAINIAHLMGLDETILKYAEEYLDLRKEEQHEQIKS